MGIRIYANGYIFFPENMKKSPVGIKISQRPVSSICVYLKCNIRFFHCFSKFPVKWFKITGGFISINPYEVAMCYYIKEF